MSVSQAALADLPPSPDQQQRVAVVQSDKMAAPHLPSAFVIPSSVTVVTSHDQNLFFHGQDVIAAVGRNLSMPAKCTSSAHAVIVSSGPV